jgi:hypothetical protein
MHDTAVSIPLGTVAALRTKYHFNSKMYVVRLIFRLQGKWYLLSIDEMFLLSN